MTKEEIKQYKSEAYSEAAEHLTVMAGEMREADQKDEKEIFLKVARHLASRAITALE